VELVKCNVVIIEIEVSNSRDGPGEAKSKVLNQRPLQLSGKGKSPGFGRGPNYLDALHRFFLYIRKQKAE
jgi:hypothetical protein